MALELGANDEDSTTITLATTLDGLEAASVGAVAGAVGDPLHRGRGTTEDLERGRGDLLALVRDAAALGEVTSGPVKS